MDSSSLKTKCFCLMWLSEGENICLQLWNQNIIEDEDIYLKEVNQYLARDQVSH